ncbi:hypothetical protein EV122DRAFT_294999 [Schizophyllum commune]
MGLRLDSWPGALATSRSQSPSMPTPPGEGAWWGDSKQLLTCPTPTLTDAQADARIPFEPLIPSRPIHRWCSVDLTSSFFVFTMGPISTRVWTLVLIATGEAKRVRV